MIMGGWFLLPIESQAIKNVVVGGERPCFLAICSLLLRLFRIFRGFEPGLVVHLLLLEVLIIHPRAEQPVKVNKGNAKVALEAVMVQLVKTKKKKKRKTKSP